MIEIQDLYKYYGERRVVGPLSAKIEKGEIIGLLGLNGAGKTTTLRVLACDLLPTSGTVRVGGFDVVEQPHEVRGKVGYLPDRPPLYDDMTVHEYLGYAARLRRVRPNDVEKRVSEVEGMTELGDVRRQLVGTLSHGYRQRLGIAQAIVHRPDFVVLDEPIGGLDPIQIVEMRGLVRGLRGEHTVVVSSHILHEISETCDRIFVIQNGEILWSGREADLSTQVEKGMRIRVTGRVAGTAPEAAGERLAALLIAVPGVRAVEPRDATESGEGIASVEVAAESDVRDALCRALVTADAAVLEVSRLRDLETTFRALLEGSTS
ncbi:MAG TPA: ABC transporter ATP-binding protein [Polyangiaceae bacterium]|nr:ABC transporter ATP-binding protein [Polyangiaceae bacterium]